MKSLEPYNNDKMEDPSIKMMGMIDEVMIFLAGQVCEDIINGTPYKDSYSSQGETTRVLQTMVMLYMMDQSEIDFICCVDVRTHLAVAYQFMVMG